MDAGLSKGMLDLFEQLHAMLCELHYTPAAEPLFAPCAAKLAGGDVPQTFCLAVILKVRTMQGAS